MQKLGFIDPDMFGNEAGEEEDREILTSYFVDKPEFRPFHSPKNSLAIIRAKKGVGKSSLLAKIASDASKKDENSLVVYGKGSDLASFDIPMTLDPAQLINGWQQRICSLINLELGKGIKAAFDDSSIMLVEASEIAGYRDRNLLGSLIDRFDNKMKTKKLDQVNPAQLLHRYIKKKRSEDLKIWLIIDDIDATFIDQRKPRLMLSSFFSACRKMSSEYKGVLFRVSVRSDVWETLARSDESLDKCEQYITDLYWSQSEARKILVNKIYTYIQRSDDVRSELKGFIPNLDSDKLIESVFKSPFPWGDGKVSPDVPIHILSNGRPRWSSQLCKLAAERAIKSDQKELTFGHISSSMTQYGKMRVDDLYREHSHQYKDLQILIETFSGGAIRYKTDSLLLRIQQKIIARHGGPVINGVKATNPSLNLAHFLFKIGFFHGKLVEAGKTPTFISYQQRQDLLTNQVNIDDGLIWEIHPSYRTVLKMKSN